MNLMWFENFWVVGGVVLFFVLVLAVCLFFLALLSMFVFNSSLFSVFNSSFVVLVKFEYILKSSFAVLVVTVLEFIFLFSFSVSLLIVWMFLFSVPVLQASVSNSPFSVLAFVILSKSSNWGALRPFSNWHFEPYGSALWRNPLEFEFLLAGSNWDAFAPSSNWHFEPYSCELWRNPLGFEFLITGSNWHFGTDRWKDYKNPLGARIFTDKFTLRIRTTLKWRL